MTGQWLADLISNASVDIRRTQCADAATRRVSAVGVNLDGLDTGERDRRRTMCLNAALLRFVQPDVPTATVHYGRGVNTPFALDTTHYTLDS